MLEKHGQALGVVRVYKTSDRWYCLSAPVKAAIRVSWIGAEALRGLSPMRTGVPKTPTAAERKAFPQIAADVL